MHGLRKAAAKRGIKLSRKSTMLYRGKHVFINGESFMMGAADRKLLAGLADKRKLEGAAVLTASADVLEAFYTWYQDGWIVLG